MSEIKLVSGVFQDGDCFYQEIGDEDATLIVRYPGVVRHDHDMEGVFEARRLLLRDYPEYAYAVFTEPTEQGNQYVIPGCEKDQSRGPAQGSLW